MKWRRFLTPVRIIISLGLIAFLIWRADPAQVWARWRDANPWIVALAIVLQLAGVAMNAARWGQLLAASNQPQPYGWLLRSYLAGQFANNFLPTSVGGDAVRAAQLARRIGSLSSASASVFLERLTGFLALSLIANLALIWSFLDRSQHPLVTAPGLLLVTILFSVAAVSAMVISFLAPQIVQRVDRWLPQAIMRPLQRIAQALAESAPQGRTFFKVLAFSLAYQTLWIVNHSVCGWALGIDVPQVIYFLMVPITDMVGLAPLFVNNLGAREAVFSLYLAQVGIPAATAIALAFLIFTVRLAVSLVGGLVVVYKSME